MTSLRTSPPCRPRGESAAALAAALVAACLAWPATAPAQGVDSSPFGFFFDGSEDETDFSNAGAETMRIEAGTKGDAAPDVYREPDFSKALFDRTASGLGDEEQKRAARLLTAVATNFPDDPVVTHRLREKALVVAKQFDPASPSILTANSMLKRGLPPRPTEGAGSIKEISDELWSMAVPLLDETDEVAQRAGAFLAEIAARLSPKDVFKYAKMDLLVADGTLPKWDGILGTGEPKTGEDPGAGATPAAAAGPKLLLTRARANVVLLEVNPDNTTTGAIAPVSIEASQNPEGGTLALTVNGGGSRLHKAAEAAAEAVALDGTNWPQGVEAKIDVGRNYRAHERDSAAVACAVLVDALMSGRPVDPAAAFTGGVAGSGEVTPVRELANRLRGLPSEGTVNIVGVPWEAEESVQEVTDLCALGASETLAKVQIFGISSVADALALAPQDRDSNLQKAIDLFSEFQRLTAQQPVDDLIKTRPVQDRFREIVALAPNHLSARYLFRIATNQKFGKLSFQGSRDALTAAALPIGKAAGYKTGTKEVILNSPVDVCTGALFHLRDLRPKLHPSTLGYADALSRYTEALKAFLQTSMGGSARARTMRNTMNDALRDLSRAAEEFRRIEKTLYESE